MTLSFAMPLSYFSTSIEATHDTGKFTELAMKQRLWPVHGITASTQKMLRGITSPGD
jgi:hypothetical protein